MTVKYDADVDILYISLADNALIDESSEPFPGLVLDHDATGRVVGLELLNASRTVSLPFSVEATTEGSADSAVGRAVRESRGASPDIQAAIVADRWPLADVSGMPISVTTAGAGRK